MKKPGCIVFSPLAGAVRTQRALVAGEIPRDAKRMGRHSRLSTLRSVSRTSTRTSTSARGWDWQRNRLVNRGTDVALPGPELADESVFARTRGAVLLFSSLGL